MTILLEDPVGVSFLLSLSSYLHTYIHVYMHTLCMYACTVQYLCCRNVFKKNCCYCITPRSKKRGKFLAACNSSPFLKRFDLTSMHACVHVAGRVVAVGQGGGR